MAEGSFRWGDFLFGGVRAAAELGCQGFHRKEQLRSLIPNGKLHALISNIRSVLHIKQLLLCTTPGHRSHKNKTHDLAEKLYS